MPGVSKRELARLLGVSDTAVRKAEKAGRIKPLPDGGYDPEAAQAAWGADTDPARTKVRTPREPGSQVRTPPVRSPDDARDAVRLIQQVLEEEGAEAFGVIDFGQARTAETILKARERHLKIAQRRKELVPIGEVRRHVEKAFVGYRQAVQRLPGRFGAEMAAELRCDAGALDAVLSRVIAKVLNELSGPVVRA